MKHALFLILVFTNIISFAQDTDSTEAEPYIEKEFVIIQSTPDYNSALNTAKNAAYKLNTKLDLRGLKKNKQIGLSWSQKVCDNEWDEFPCYVARGRWDDGDYVSIEYSNAYSGFKKGYYIVIISSGVKGENSVKDALTKARAIYKDAYKKISKVYVGCMH